MQTEFPGSRAEVRRNSGDICNLPNGEDARNGRGQGSKDLHIISEDAAHPSHKPGRELPNA